MPTLNTTPLHSLHIERGARMVDFAGFDMPVQYHSIVDEHLCVRSIAGLFDVSHMGEISVQGPHAQKFLLHLLTNEISKIQPNQCQYSPMCQPDGGVVDDLISYCYSPEHYLLCVNASNIEKDFQWITQNAQSFDVQIENLSSHYGQLALQGPQSFEILSKILPDLSIKRFHFCETQIDDIPVLISRTGYTGEDGVEIYIPSQATEKIAELILQTGEPTGLQLIGLGARDSLRLEAGYSLYGHEISEKISPVQAGLNFAISFDNNRTFIGSDTLKEQANNPLKQKVLFFTLDGRRIARPGTDIVNSQGQVVGQVLSGTHSPCLKKPIGSALIQAPHFESGTLAATIGKDSFPLKITKPPFFQK